MSSRCSLLMWYWKPQFDMIRGFIGLCLSEYSKTTFDEKKRHVKNLCPSFYKPVSLKTLVLRSTFAICLSPVTPTSYRRRKCACSHGWDSPAHDHTEMDEKTQYWGGGGGGGGMFQMAIITDPWEKVLLSFSELKGLNIGRTWINVSQIKPVVRSRAEDEASHCQVHNYRTWCRKTLWLSAKVLSCTAPITFLDHYNM